jgi:hypothetical protein
MEEGRDYYYKILGVNRSLPLSLPLFPPFDNSSLIVSLLNMRSQRHMKI